MSLDKLDVVPVDTHVWQIAARDYLPSVKQAKSLTDKLYKQIGEYMSRYLSLHMSSWKQLCIMVPLPENFVFCSFHKVIKCTMIIETTCTLFVSVLYQISITKECLECPLLCLWCIWQTRGIYIYTVKPYLSGHLIGNQFTMLSLLLPSLPHSLLSIPDSHIFLGLAIAIWQSM